jgi:hypothetical protein
MNMRSAPPINIWIHGTKPQRLFPDPISSMHIEPLHKFMYCKRGLHRAQELDTSFHHHAIALALHKGNPHEFPWETLYLFGWSGALNVQERWAAAQRLYKDLKIICADYKQTYQEQPTIRIIGHSHGGNVALNLARLHEQAPYPCVITDLMLLACPVQTVTAPFVKSPLFCKIYSLHSHWDFMQIADPQGWPTLKQELLKLFHATSIADLKISIARIEQGQFFSGRHFQPRRNLIQAVIKMDGRHLLHIEFMLIPFVKNIPLLLHKFSSFDLEKIPIEHDIVAEISSQES